MSEQTKIEWADATWNPWIGCTKISPGCANCFAAVSTFTRSKRSHGVELWGRGAQRHRTSVEYWKKPHVWNRAPRLAPGTPRPRIFPSLCDWLDDEVPIELLADFAGLMHATRNLDWLLLTKRPENFFRRLTAVNCAPGSGLIDRAKQVGGEESALTAAWVEFWRTGEAVPRNVWVGTSVEDQQRADERIPELLKIPARVRFLSVEPMLGPVDLDRWFWQLPEPLCGNCPKDIDCECGYKTAKENGRPTIDWVIVGGESGHKARPCNVEWVRDIVRQCKAAGVPCFVKQLGSNLLDADIEECARASGKSMAHPKGGDPSEWPEDLRVREFPEVGR